MANILSKGGSIVDSNDKLRVRLQQILEDALEDNHIINECFMDLGLFFEDQKIPVAALIDMWTELNNLDEDIIDGINIVHELDNRHLVNLVVTRYISQSFNYGYSFKLRFLIPYHIESQLSVGLIVRL